MSDNKPLNRIPHFLTAETPQALQKSMLKNNIDKDKPFEYYDIGRQGPQWFAWYYDRVAIAKKESAGIHKKVTKKRVRK